MFKPSFDTVAAIGSANLKMNATVTLQYVNQIEHIQKQTYTFNNSNFPAGVLVVKKNQSQEVKSELKQFKTIHAVADAIQQSPLDMFIIASNGKVEDDELPQVKKVLLQWATTKHHKNQIESMECGDAFVLVYHGDNHYDLEINSDSCIIQLKYNSMNQKYFKQFDSYQASVLKLTASSPLVPIDDYLQTITFQVRIQNSGAIKWPQSTQLVSSFNNNVNIKFISNIPSLLPNEEATINITLEYKASELNRRILFRLATMEGDVFGESILVDPPIASIVSASFDNGVAKVWDIASKQVVSTFTKCKNPISIVWNKETEVLGWKEGTIAVWNSSTKKFDLTLQHKATVLCLCRLNNETVVSGSADMTLKMWNVNTKELIHTLTGHTGSVRCIAKIDDETIASSDDQSIKFWNTLTGECKNTIQTNHTRCITQLAVLPEKQLIISAAEYDKSLEVWDWNTNQLVYTFKDDFSSISSLIAMNEHQLISSSSYSSKICVWNTNTWECESIQNNRSIIHLVKLNEELFATTDMDGNIKIWDINRKQCVSGWEAHAEPIDFLYMQ